MSTETMWFAELEAWSTAVTAGVAIVAAFYAARQVKMARLDREDRDRPFVTVSIRPSHSIIASFVIRNEGATVARNVRFEFDPPWESTSPERTARIVGSRVWREGIPTMVPGQELTLLADRFPDRLESDLPRSYTVTVTCDARSSSRRLRRDRPRRLTDKYTVDFEIFTGYNSVAVYGTHEVADALRGIRRIFDGWSERTGGPVSVVARDGDRADAQERVDFDEWRAQEVAADAPAEPPASREGHAWARTRPLARVYRALSALGRRR